MPTLSRIEQHTTKITELLASYEDVLLARHEIFLANERLLERAANSFPIVTKNQLEITWR